MVTQCRNCIIDPSVSTSAVPLNISWYNQRHQSLYSALLLKDSGLRAGDRITEVALRVSDSSYVTLQNFQVYLL